jgi:hypothetical protein
MPQEKLEELLAKLGPEKTNQMMDSLDEYADINPKRFKGYGCHAAVILKWVKDDEKKGISTSKTGAEVNKEWALKVKEKVKNENIEVMAECIMFTNPTGHNTIMFYKDNGFKDMVISRLKKMGLPTTGL